MSSRSHARRRRSERRSSCRSRATERHTSRSDASLTRAHFANTLETRDGGWGPKFSRACTSIASRRMDARGIHHLGVAVEDLDAALSTYERLFGAQVEHRATVADKGVRPAAPRPGDGRGG